MINSNALGMKRQSFIIILILLFIGNIANGQNYSSDSLKVEKLKKQLSKSTGEKRFKILLELSDLKKYFPEGTKYAQEAVELSEKLDDRAKSDANYKLGETYSMQFEYSDAFENYQKSLETCLKNKYTDGILRAKQAISLCYLQLDSIQQSEIITKQLFAEATRLDSLRYLGNATFQLGMIEQQKENQDSALIFFNQGLEILNKIESNVDIANAYNKMGNFFTERSDFFKAIEYYSREILIRESLHDPIRLAAAYLNFGKTNRSLEIYKLASENIEMALTLFEKNKFTLGMMASLNELGFIYMGSYQGLSSKEYESNLYKALECFQKEIELLKGNKYVEAEMLINIGNVHYGLALNKFTEKYGKDFTDSLVNLSSEEILASLSKSIDVYKQSIKLFKELNDKYLDAVVYENIGSKYVLARKWSDADYYITKGIQAAKSQENNTDLISNLLLLAESKLSQKKPDQAEPLLTECYQLIKKEYSKENDIKYLEFSAKMHEQKGQSAKALELLKKSVKMKNDISTEKMRETVRVAQNQYEDIIESTKKLYEAEQQLQRSKIKQQKQFLNITIIGSLFLVSIALFSIWLLLQKRRVNKILESSYKELDEQNYLIESKNIILEEQKEEITAQRDEIIANQNMIVQQNELLARKNSDMLDSILYAKRIQEALLPNEHYIDEIIPDNFIIYKPRDVVSGDFYWIRQVNQYTIIVAADCTGHGVPGAFMSMLGISMLNEIVVRRGITQANVILNELRKQLKRSLRQTGKDQEAKDGMDMALCILDTGANHLQYSGAYNPLILATQGEIQEYSADRMPIGIQLNEKPTFTNHEIDLKPGDTFYIFTDGFVDQLGGPVGKKFMMKELKNLLTKINEKSLPEQRYILENTLADWMKGSEQTDDILIMGFRV